MKRAVLFVTIILLVCATSISAQEIGLKKSFFSGWRYTTDGFTYAPVGSSAKELMSLMDGNGEAIEHLKSYKRSNSASLILGILSVAGSGVSIYMAGSDDKQTQEQGLIILLVSLPLAIGSSAAGVSATNHLVEAVRLHNGGVRCHETNTAGGREPSGKPGFGVSFSLSF